MLTYLPLLEGQGVGVIAGAVVVRVFCLSMREREGD